MKQLVPWPQEPAPKALYAVCLAGRKQADETQIERHHHWASKPGPESAYFLRQRLSFSLKI